MKMTFRWFGENSDTVSLKQIRQIPGVSGIMGFLDYKAAGEVWEKDEIGSFVGKVHDAGLACEVIESVNVHEDIKLGLPTRDRYIASYCETIRNLAEFGVKVIIYNFMPVFDWLRTDLARVIPEDGSNSMYYDEKELEGLSVMDLVRSMEGGSNGFSLPGWEPERVKELEKTLSLYDGMTQEDLLVNFKFFLDGILPTCERYGVKMACHPDDPCWPIFGLPRVGYSQYWFDRIMELNPSPCNTVCLCTGSLGSNRENDVPAMIRHFGERGQISCMHIRNIRFYGERKFREAAHNSCDGDFDMFAIVKAMHDFCPDVYVRPDHGRMIWDETGRPGYGLYDRALGTQYLMGLYEAIDRNSGL